MTPFLVVPNLSGMNRNVNGAAIRALREKDGWKVGKFATQIGVSSSYLSNIEAGRKQPGPDITRKIADLLAVPLAAITTEFDLADIA